MLPSPWSTLIKAGERLDDLAYRGRHLLQREEGFCFSLDAVLLAHFARDSLKKRDRLLDLGTGTGVLPLFLIDIVKDIWAIERQAEMADIARRNVMGNALEERIHILHGDYRRLDEYISRETFDAVISNPPYFPVGEGEISPVSSIALARHECTATLADTVQAARFALRFGGHFYLVHRASRLMDIFERLHTVKLEPKRLRFVHPFVDAPADLVLLEARVGGKAGLVVESPLVVRERSGAYTREVAMYYA